MRNGSASQWLSSMGSLQANEDKEHAAAVRKALGSVLRQSYDDVVSKVPDRIKDLLQRLDHVEQTRSLNSKKWW